MLVEAAVESLDAALAAEAGGAHRIEWCADLAQGGVTPALDILPAVQIPVFVLVRPRAGDFVYSAAEHRLMLEQIAQAKRAGAHGIVSGSLMASDEIDEGRTAELIQASRPLPFTFHRAIDIPVYTSIHSALEIPLKLGVDRVLTSGGASTAPGGAKQIAALVQQAAGRIVVVAGGGITPDNAAKLVRDTGVREIHFSVENAQKVRDVLESL